VTCACKLFLLEGGFTNRLDEVGWSDGSLVDHVAEEAGVSTSVGDVDLEAPTAFLELLSFFDPFIIPSTSIFFVFLTDFFEASCSDLAFAFFVEMLVSTGFVIATRDLHRFPVLSKAEESEADVRITIGSCSLSAESCVGRFGIRCLGTPSS